MLHEIAIEGVLALLLQTKHGIEFRLGLAGQHAAQKLHIGRWHFHVHQEISPAEGKQHANAPGLQQYGIQIQFAAVIAQYRHGKRVAHTTIDDLAENISGFVAVKGRGQYLDLQIGLRRRPPGGKIVVDRAQHTGQIAAQAGKRQRPGKITHDLPHHLAQTAGRRIVTTITRRIRLDIFGRNGRTDENEIVVEVIPVQHAGEHRIEKGLGQFRLLVVGQQANEVQLGLLPDFIIQQIGMKFVMQPANRFLHPFIIKLDTVADGLLHALPVRALEQ